MPFNEGFLVILGCQRLNNQSQDTQQWKLNPRGQVIGRFFWYNHCTIYYLPRNCSILLLKSFSVCHRKCPNLLYAVQGSSYVDLAYLDCLISGHYLLPLLPLPGNTNNPCSNCTKSLSVFECPMLPHFLVFAYAFSISDITCPSLSFHPPSLHPPSCRFQVQLSSFRSPL